jgi:septal ring factor EnvC (AmiA/AmiB activator)
VKKNKFTEFFKGKGYYVLLFVGVIAIAAVALIGSQLSSSNQKDQNQEYVDLNDTDNNIAAKDKAADNNSVSKDVANNASDKSSDTAKDTAKDVAGNDVEYEGYADANVDKKQAAADTKDKSVETTGKSVKSENSTALEALSFNTEKGLAWPVDGNVIIDYSMDHTTYFSTLMQYKCNPAIIIDAEVGTNVKAATDGIITAIDKNNDETGYTLTMGIGDDYNLVYGQLDKDSVKYKVGDKVASGAVIGKVAKPTNYYVVEGSNLYFEVTQKDKPVNPMLYLK